MPRDYMEVENVEDFLKVAEKTDIVIRADPFLLVNYYGIFIYIDLRKLKSQDIRKLLVDLKNKIIHVRRHKTVSSLEELL